MLTLIALPVMLQTPTLSGLPGMPVNRMLAPPGLWRAWMVLPVIVPSRTLPWPARSNQMSATGGPPGAKLYSMSLPVIWKFRISLATTLMPPCRQ